MPLRISWTQHEVALLIDAYLHIAEGADLGQTAKELSLTLRNLALRMGLSIDDTYRNVNGMKMQLGNVQYLFTEGQKGLSGASSMIRQMVEMYREKPEQFQQVLKEAIRMTGPIESIEDAFFAYAKKRLGLSPRMLTEYLQKAADYCHRKQPLLGMTDINAVGHVQKKVTEGKMLRIRYGKEAQTIRTVTQLYYTFIKSYREQKDELPVQRTPVEEKVEPAQSTPAMNTTEVDTVFEPQAGVLTETSEEDPSDSNVAILHKEEKEQAGDQLRVDFSRDNSFLFTKPISYTYKGILHDAKSWSKLYMEVCGLLFADHYEAFMSIMNGDVPGYSALAFADEQNYRRMRAPKNFAPGYYLESNMDATSIVRRIRGLYQLFDLGDSLWISYIKQSDTKTGKVPEEPDEEWLIHELKSRYIPFIDNRSADGCLWIASDLSIPIQLNEAEERGYRLRFKQDGCRAFPNQPVLWTKDQPEKPISTTDFRRKLDENFKPYLLEIKKLASPTAAQYSQSIEAVERFILERGLDCTLDTTDPVEVQRIYDILQGRKDFVDWNNQRHHQYSAALAQYISYLRQDETYAGESKPGDALTIKDVAVIVLHEAGQPLTMPEIMQQIEASQLYVFNSNNPMLILYQGIRRYCRGMKAPNHAPVDVFDRFTDEAGQIRYTLIGDVPMHVEEEIYEPTVVDERWLPILQDSFPDGYILNDFLGQFQAAAYWQERYGENCPIQGDAIDAAMKAVGAIRDGRVFVKSEEDKQLISTICAEISDILSFYTTVYRSCVYERYQDQLSSISIYTEPVMTQQLLAEAKGNFYSVNQVFAKRGQYASVIQDARKVLRDHGGPMPVDDVAKVLWFIPRDMVYHYLSVDDESLNIGSSTWMLAEHFPVTHEDAAKIGNMLDEYFLTNSYVQAFDLMPLLRDRLPSIADNLSDMTYQAIFNIVQYYLRDRFNFTKAIISPKGTSVDFTDLFRSFASEHETFTLGDLEALANELKLPIYWESTYAGGAVRVSKTEFVNRRRIQFDVETTDAVLADFCPGDYLPLMSVSSAMMMHLPSCGYRWNGYLLQSYVYGFSKLFRLSYSSFGKTGYYGAMVRRSSKTINNYGSLIERVLTDDDTWETTADALDVLVKHGYQAVRKYKGIDNVVARAKRNKLPDDGR